MSAREGCPYPLRETTQRTLPPDYEGPVFVSDIDKTYLATRFSSMKGLARIPLEFAVDKSAMAGMSEVLRGVRRGPGPAFAAAPLFFVSSSPPQLEGVIARKMLLDGVQPDGFTFKDWVATVRALRPRRLKDHLGFKLAALLHGRRLRPLATEHLLGDDVERDAEVYSLYARAISGELSPVGLDSAIAAGGVSAEDRRIALDLLARLPRRGDAVGGVYILLVRGTAPEAVARHGGPIVPVRDAFQLAMALCGRRLVDRGCVEAARRSVAEAARLDDDGLATRVEDALARGIISAETADFFRTGHIGR